MPFSPRRLSPPILVAALFLARSAGATPPAQPAGDDTSALEGLLEEEVVTTASKSAERASDAPAFSRSISAEEIRRFGIRSLDEAIDFLGVGLRTAHGPGNAEITGRGVGFTGDKQGHVLLLVDGHILNEPLAGGTNLDQGAGIPLEMIDHVELVCGPGSSVYGSNAVLGVVNVVTKSASADAGTHVALELSPLYDGRASITGGYSFDLFGKRTDVSAGVSYYRKDGPSYDVGPQNVGVNPVTGQPYRFSATGPATGIWGGTIKNENFVHVPGAHVRIVRDRTELIARGAIYEYAFPFGGDFDDPRTELRDRRLSVSLRQGIPIGSIAEASVRTYVDFFRFHISTGSSEPSACAAGVTTCVVEGNNASRRLGAEGSLSFDWLKDRRLTTMVTAQAVANTIAMRTALVNGDSGALVAPEQTIIPEQTKPILAASVEQAYRPLPWLGLSAGARVDDDPRFDPTLSPRAALSVNPWQGSTLKAIYSYAFRTPSYYESNAFVPSLQIPAVGLTPEEVSSYELVTEQRFGRSRLAMDLFFLDFEQTVNTEHLTPAETAAAIAAGVPGATPTAFQLVQNRNVDDIHSYGFTATAETAALEGSLRLGGSFTGSFAHHLSDPEKVTVAPQVFGNAHASYTFGGYLPTLGVAGTFSGRTVVDRAYEVGWPRTPTAPPQLDLRATVSGPVVWVKGLSYRVIAGYTVHDRAPYAIGPATHPSPGISQPELFPTQRWHGTLGLQYDF